MKQRWLLALLAAVLMLGAACGSDDDESGDSDAASNAGSETESSQPTDEPTEGSDGGGGAITIEGVDFAFKTPATAPAGETEITFENNGKEPHQLIMAQLSEDAPELQELLKLEDKELNKYIENEIEDAAKPIKPGDSTTFTTDLQPATYAMVCFVESKENGGQPHAFLGMVNQITVE